MSSPPNRESQGSPMRINSATLLRVVRPAVIALFLFGPAMMVLSQVCTLHVEGLGYCASTDTRRVTILAEAFWFRGFPRVSAEVHKFYSRELPDFSVFIHRDQFSKGWACDIPWATIILPWCTLWLILLLNCKQPRQRPSFPLTISGDPAAPCENLSNQS